MVLAELEDVVDDNLMVPNLGNSLRTVTVKKPKARLCGGVRTTIMTRECMFGTLLLTMVNGIGSRTVSNMYQGDVGNGGGGGTEGAARTTAGAGVLALSSQDASLLTLALGNELEQVLCLYGMSDTDVDRAWDKSVARWQSKG